MLSRFFGRALFGVARIKSSAGTIAAAFVATSGTGHNLLEAFFQVDRNPENDTSDVYVHWWFYLFGT
ncbi:hypothetical protein EUGRSUZ_H04858 [Eucalyptus grandis]|uniref:Uncharacterized protein n=2 Tax=Eucalyptus grandis TaxID=71139 RepID=A0ACC3JYD4_EUCGR|nr:hypothetical protein EUGRSUZ_H04858 [Eucalyptus grandis]